MKKWILFLIIFFPLLSMIGCSDSNNDNKEDIIKVSDNELNFKAEGEKRSITITSNAQWKIIVADNTRCKANPLKGNVGTTIVSVEISGNTEKTAQTTQITIKTSNKSAIVNINQEAVSQKAEGFYYPLLTINTENNKPIISKNDYLNAVITLESRDEKGEIAEKLLEGETEIRGRGNTTWDMEKKPYRLKLSKSSEILGMPKSKHWVLLANYSDKTLMRNKLAFEVSRRMGFVYTTRSEYVDVILNGDYIGNYLLCEHIRVDKDRINIPELKPSDTNITGGYLLEIDGRKGEPEWFETERAKMIFCINTPEDIPANQKIYIQNYIQNIEDIIYGKDGVNTVAELPKYLDLKSFIDYLLLNELSKNVDGNLRLSTFVYKNRNDDKLYFGPVWDYDIAFGNVNYDGCDNISGWHARTADWYQKFFTHAEFEKMMVDRWKELRSGELNNLKSFIDDWAKKMEISQQNNFKRWPILSKAVWPNPVVPGSYRGEAGYLNNWMDSRLRWMDQQLK